jgi:hypothetical protein
MTGLGASSYKYVRKFLLGNFNLAAYEEENKQFTLEGLPAKLEQKLLKISESDCNTSSNSK